jgi:hypothetical protein
LFTDSSPRSTAHLIEPQLGSTLVTGFKANNQKTQLARIGMKLNKKGQLEYFRLAFFDGKQLFSS